MYEFMYKSTISLWRIGEINNTKLTYNIKFILKVKLFGRFVGYLLYFVDYD